MAKEDKPTILDSVFPLDDDYDELTLGYPDLTGGIVRSNLAGLNPQDLKTVHRYAELGRVGFFLQMDFLAGLIAGLHERDPERKSEGALRLASEEIEGASDHLRLLSEAEFIPYIVPSESAEGMSDDAYGLGWFIYPTLTDQSIWLPEYPEAIEVVKNFLYDPSTEGTYNDLLRDILTTLHEMYSKPKIITLNGEEFIQFVNSVMSSGGLQGEPNA